MQPGRKEHVLELEVRLEIPYEYGSEKDELALLDEVHPEALLFSALVSREALPPVISHASWRYEDRRASRTELK